MLLDVLTYANSDLDGLFNLLILTHHHLGPPGECITAYTRAACIQTYLFFKIQKHISKCRFKTSNVITTCVPVNKQSSPLQRMKYRESIAL